MLDATSASTTATTSATARESNASTPSGSRLQHLSSFKKISKQYMKRALEEYETESHQPRLVENVDVYVYLAYLAYCDRVSQRVSEAGSVAEMSFTQFAQQLQAASKVR